MPQYDQLFQQTNGWSGADGDFTVALTNGLTLWLFSDTFVGEVRAGRRARATMINNSAALQHRLARAPEETLGDFASWRFRTRNDWSTNAEAAVDLCGGMASEYSVSWSAALRQFVLICTENGLSEKIIARTAKEPWGPWSSANVIYRCPEVTWDKQVFCYAAKAHPMLATTPNELIVTYAANSFDFAQIVNDARLYWPRFVRVKLPPNAALEPAPITP